ncbi:MAG TPA: hypothetical protein VGH47_00120 [Xanthobacteraceae bacterium]|jgi:hypothetical protein
MTHDDALDLVISIASTWGENAEEAFPQRLTATTSDAEIRRMLTEPDYSDEDIKAAVVVRDLWLAISILQSKS